MFFTQIGFYLSEVEVDHLQLGLQLFHDWPLDQLFSALLNEDLELFPEFV